MKNKKDIYKGEYVRLDTYNKFNHFRIISSDRDDEYHTTELVDIMKELEDLRRLLIDGKDILTIDYDDEEKTTEFPDGRKFYNRRIDILNNLQYLQNCTFGELEDDLQVIIDKLKKAKNRK